MSKAWVADDKQNVKQRKQQAKEPVKQAPIELKANVAQVTRLQRTVGNRAVQRLLAQRSGDAGFELDEETAGRINRARGGGQPLEGALQEQMGASMGYDFSGVRVHTSPESDDLNRQLSARAFTTGQDIFVRQGDYAPHSSGGRELIAHELSHVVQQTTGRVGGSGGRMTVRPAGDAFEQEADALARQAANAAYAPGAQAAEGGVQRQDIPEEEELQTKAIQRQDVPEEEEEIQAKALQRQDEIPEEELQT